MSLRKSLLKTLAFLLTVTAASATPTLNYQGRITAGGQDYTGNGYFKFVLYGGNGWPLWANDGGTTTNQPATSVMLNVFSGLFTTELGDTTIANMAALPATIFHDDAIWLTTWFSTNNVDFEELSGSVRIHPPDFAHINTGRMLVVDPQTGSGADFTEIQDALDALGQTNAWGGHNFDGVLLMPGYYEIAQPLQFPTNRTNAMRPFLRGAGDMRSCWVQNTNNGPTLVITTEVWIQNVGLRGNPALTDAGLSDPVDFFAAACQFTRESGDGPVVYLTNSQFNATDCQLRNWENGPALQLSGDAEVNFRDCDLSASGADAPACLMDGLLEGSNSRFADCELSADRDAGGYSLRYVECEWDNDNFYSCFLYDGVASVSNEHGANFVACEVGGFDSMIGGANFEFQECEINTEGSGRPAVSLAGCWGNVRLRNCDINTESNACLNVYDSPAWVLVKDCEIGAQDATAIHVECDEFSGPDGRANGVRIIGGSIVASSGTGATDIDAIRVINTHPSNDTWRAGIHLRDVEISGWIRDALHVQGGQAQVIRSKCEGKRNALTLTNADVVVQASTIDGTETGIQLGGATVIDIEEGSSVEAGDEEQGISGYGIYAVADACELNMSDSGVDEEGGGGTGVLFRATDPQSSFFVGNCNINGGSVAVDFSGGMSVMHRSLLSPAATSTLILRGSNTVIDIYNCELIGMMDGNTNAVILLDASDGEGVPTPRVLGSRIVSAFSMADSPHSIALGGGATTGNVTLANCVLGAPVGNGIGLVPAANIPYGNVVLP